MSTYTDADVTAAAQAIHAHEMSTGYAADGWDHADQEWLTADARAALAAVAPAIAARAKAEALRDIEATFRTMALAGYNDQIVAGIEGCADLIADRLFCDEFGTKKRTP